MSDPFAGKGFETRAVHAGAAPDPATGAREVLPAVPVTLENQEAVNLDLFGSRS